MPSVLPNPVTDEPHRSCITEHDRMIVRIRPARIMDGCDPQEKGVAGRRSSATGPGACDEHSLEKTA